MTESQKTSQFLTRLRKLMPHAVVVKHADKSMIGLPDFSVTYRGHVVWFEAKLYALPKKIMAGQPGFYDGFVGLSYFLAKARGESPVQAAMMDKLGQASASLYLLWIKKTCALLCTPDGLQYRKFMNDDQLAEFIYDLFNRWDSPKFPELY